MFFWNNFQQKARQKYKHVNKKAPLEEIDVCVCVCIGGICYCRHCRRQCKIFASGVNVSIFTHFFLFFLTKTVEIRWNWRCKIFSLKIRQCNIFDKFHVEVANSDAALPPGIITKPLLLSKQPVSSTPKSSDVSFFLFFSISVSNICRREGEHDEAISERWFL